MTTNETSKKLQTPSKTEVKNSVAKGSSKGFMSIAEVRMVLYVVPVALCLALFVYLNTHGYSLLYAILIPAALGAIMFFVVLRLLKKYK